MVKDLRSENDNLQAWRNKRLQLTKDLLKKSLEELIKLNATINQKTVCDMMSKLSTREEKEYKAVISPSAISKNNLYKNMIFEDKQLEIFQLKTLIAKKEAKIKELESIINRANPRTV